MGHCCIRWGSTSYNREGDVLEVFVHNFYADFVVRSIFRTRLLARRPSQRALAEFLELQARRPGEPCRLSAARGVASRHSNAAILTHHCEQT